MILLHDVTRLTLGVLLEFVQSKVRQLYNPSRIHQAVRRTQRTVKFYDGLVQIDHPLESVQAVANLSTVNSIKGDDSGINCTRLVEYAKF